MKKYFGINADDNEALLEILGVDFRGVDIRYIGPRLHEDVPGRNVSPDWGVHTRWV